MNTPKTTPQTTQSPLSITRVIVRTGVSAGTRGNQTVYCPR